MNVQRDRWPASKQSRHSDSRSTRRQHVLRALFGNLTLQVARATAAMAKILPRDG